MQKAVTTLIIFLTSFSLFSEDSLTGVWHTGDNGTLVGILFHEEEYRGTIISCEGAAGLEGTVILKDVHFNGSTGTGKLYSPRNEKWFKGKLKVEEDTLSITVSLGLFKKKIKWQRITSPAT